MTTIPSQTSEISTVDALWVLIQGQTKAVRKALTKRLLAEQDKTKVQKAMVKESLTRRLTSFMLVRFIMSLVRMTYPIIQLIFGMVINSLQR